MKHLVKFNEGKEEYNLKEDIDDIISVLEYIITEFDIDIIHLTIADGNRRDMTYDDYLEKNDRYDRFLLGRPILDKEITEIFTIRLSFKNFNYKESVKVSNYMTPVINEIENLNWKFKSFEIRGLDGRTKVVNDQYLEYEFLRKKIVIQKDLSSNDKRNYT